MAYSNRCTTPNVGCDPCLSTLTPCYSTCKAKDMWRDFVYKKGERDPDSCNTITVITCVNPGSPVDNTFTYPVFSTRTKQLPWARIIIPMSTAKNATLTLKKHSITWKPKHIPQHTAKHAVVTFKCESMTWKAIFIPQHDVKDAICHCPEHVDPVDPVYSGDIKMIGVGIGYIRSKIILAKVDDMSEFQSEDRCPENPIYYQVHSNRLTEKITYSRNRK